jgi:hypothetical protein
LRLEAINTQKQKNTKSFSNFFPEKKAMLTLTSSSDIDLAARVIRIFFCQELKHLAISAEV